MSMDDLKFLSLKFAREMIQKVTKKGKLRASFSFKQQVMTDCPRIFSGAIGVETPAILFVVLNRFCNPFMMANFHAFPFFQLNLTFSTMKRKSTELYWNGWVLVTFGMIAETSPSKLFKNCSSLSSSLVILISNLWTLYLVFFFPPSVVLSHRIESVEYKYSAGERK